MTEPTSASVTRSAASIAIRMYLAAELASIAEALRAEVEAGRCSPELVDTVIDEAGSASWWALFDLNAEQAPYLEREQRISAVRDWCRDHLDEIADVRGWADDALRLGDRP